MSLLQKLRQQYQPPLPKILQNLKAVSFLKEKVNSDEKIKGLFPQTFSQPLLRAQKGQGSEDQLLRVGLVFSGGQAAGGHNVISGAFDTLKALNPESRVFGFLGGPSGIINGKSIEITKDKIDPFRNQGGFDLIGSGRTKIEKEDQLAAALSAVQKLQLDGLVIIGGDDSNTNAALLAEYFLLKGCQTKVIGVPKTIDGDLQSPYTAISFGFDTACKVYSEMIGNIARDALSAKKYTHFIKLMGRSASHIALECALSTQPNLVLIGEEIAREKKTLEGIVKEIADLICKRSEAGKDYGVILIPEGLIEFIPEVGVLIQELNKNADVKQLTPASLHCFQTLPENIQKQLLLDRDPHGNIQLSLIETERLLIEKVSEELKLRAFKGKFNALPHFFGYEGRAAFPSNFDSNYCYVLGMTAALLINAGATSTMCFVEHLEKSVSDWEVGGVPLTGLIHMETRKGQLKPVIKKTLVNLEGKAFQFLKQNSEAWALQDAYQFLGPIQFFGEPALTDSIPHILTQ